MGTTNKEMKKKQVGGDMGPSKGKKLNGKGVAKETNLWELGKVRELEGNPLR